MEWLHQLINRQKKTLFSKTSLIRSQSLIELMLIMALLAIIIPVVATSLITTQESKAQQNQRLIANGLLKETAEAVRSVREKDWDGLYALAGAGTFHPEVSGSSWILTPGEETLPNGFKRSVTLSIVNRQPTPGNIVPTPTGIVDPSTLLVNLNVSWTEPRPMTITNSFYLTRYDNLSYTQTTQAEFDQGIKTNTVTTNNSGGEVQLGAGIGGGDWCQPSLSVNTVNLSRQGVPTSISAIQGSILAVTGLNASGPTLTEVGVSGNNPPTTEIKGEYDNTKGNNVFRDTEHYAYIATDDNFEEIKILDLTQYSNPPTNTKFLKVGYFNSPGNKNGNSVFVLGNIGYMTTSDNKFYTFDLTSRTGSRGDPLNKNKVITLAGIGNNMVVVNHPDGERYAYISVNSTTTQMQVVKVTDPVNPVLVRQVQTGNSQPGVDLSTNTTGTRAYLITNYASSTKNNFFVIDTSTISGSGNLPIIGNGYNTYAIDAMNPKGIATATGNRIIVVGSGGSIQYLVLNIEHEDNPTICGPGLVINGGANDVVTVLQDDGYAYSYVVTGDTNAELKIILGGGAGAYINIGTFESSTFYRSYSGNLMTTAFNSFKANVAQPNQTTIKIKIAVADAIDNSCDGVSFSYVGPSGMPGLPDDYYTIGSNPNLIRGLIPFTQSGSYHNPGKCFRYKVWFESTSSSATPVLYDFTVNYSP